jgi:hypothetical protein
MFSFKKLLFYYYYNFKISSFLQVFKKCVHTFHIFTLILLLLLLHLPILIIILLSLHIKHHLLIRLWLELLHFILYCLCYRLDQIREHFWII